MHRTLAGSICAIRVAATPMKQPTMDANTVWPTNSRTGLGWCMSQNKGHARISCLLLQRAERDDALSCPTAQRRAG